MGVKKPYLKIIVLYQRNKDLTVNQLKINKSRTNVVKDQHLNKLLLSQPSLDISSFVDIFNAFCGLPVDDQYTKAC